MRVLGVDPSSSACGIAIVEIGPRGGVDFSHVGMFLPGDVSQKGDDKQVRTARADSMARFGAHLDELHWESHVDVCIYEQVAMAQNTNTVRLLAYYEACVLLFAGTYGLPCYAITATSARARVLKKGNLSKEACKEPFVEKYGKHRSWALATDDEIDAAIIALALPSLMEEKNGQGKR